jgi:hypothetical protein
MRHPENHGAMRVKQLQRSLDQTLIAKKAVDRTVTLKKEDPGIGADQNGSP